MISGEWWEYRYHGDEWRHRPVEENSREHITHSAETIQLSTFWWVPTVNADFTNTDDWLIGPLTLTRYWITVIGAPESLKKQNFAAFENSSGCLIVDESLERNAYSLVYLK